MDIKAFLKTATLSQLQDLQENISSEIESRSAAPMKLDHVVTYSDGASRGNPGLAGAGVLIHDGKNRKVKEDFQFLGTCTNNEAEYRALLLALDHALSLTKGRVECYLDSELLVRQLNGQYALKSESLAPFYRQVKDRCAQFKLITFTHVPRENSNLKIVDRLANKAIDEANKHK